MTGSGKSGDPKRAERLKAALRDNLKRRKAQARRRSHAERGSERDSEREPARPRESGDPEATNR